MVAWGAEKERRREEDGEGGRGWNPSSVEMDVGDGGQFESLVDVLNVDDPEGTREWEREGRADEVEDHEPPRLVRP